MGRGKVRRVPMTVARTCFAIARGSGTRTSGALRARGSQTAGRHRDAMRGYEAKAQVMADVATVIEQARREGRDLATALRIARVTLAYISGPQPDPEQARALEAFDRQLRQLSS